jgi:hypothetical protein
MRRLRHPQSTRRRYRSNRPRTPHRVIGARRIGTGTENASQQGPADGCWRTDLLLWVDARRDGQGNAAQATGARNSRGVDDREPPAENRWKCRWKVSRPRLGGNISST